MIDSKLQDFKQDIENKTEESIEELRCIKYMDRRTFKKKGNQKQYEFNEEMGDCVSSAVTYGEAEIRCR